MTIYRTAFIVLDQLANCVAQVLPADFSRPSDTLGGSSIAKHLRHTLEFFRCFQTGYSLGTINYDNRPHDTSMEQDKAIALQTIKDIAIFLQSISGDRSLQLQTSLHRESDDYATVETTAMREVVYNIEHAVHHMAFIKIGLREVAPYVKLQDDFGIAASTIRHRVRMQAEQ